MTGTARASLVGKLDGTLTHHLTLIACRISQKSTKELTTCFSKAGVKGEAAEEGAKFVKVFT